MNLKHAVMATLAYHDIFSYPLTIEEVSTFLIEKHSTQKNVEKQLKSLIIENKIGEYKRLYYLIKRKNTVSSRLARTKHSSEKLRKAKAYSKILKLNPFIQMAGISGALAMENSHKQDDIDLVIITKANLLWTTRLLSNLLLFPVKRKPGTNISNNRACLNLFLDESDLKIKDENIYQAHEICQLKPLWQRDNSYHRLIKANNWVKKYLPNWAPNVEGLVLSEVEGLKSYAGKNKNHKALVFSRLALVIEIFAKILQLNYMKNKITIEKIEDTQLFFHPKNTQNWVLEEYQKKLRKIRTL